MVPQKYLSINPGEGCEWQVGTAKESRNKTKHFINAYLPIPTHVINKCSNHYAELANDDYKDYVDKYNNDATIQMSNKTGAQWACNSNVSPCETITINPIIPTNSVALTKYKAICTVFEQEQI